MFIIVERRKPGAGNNNISMNSQSQQSNKSIGHYNKKPKGGDKISDTSSYKNQLEENQ
jgi:hypothetical protein